MVSNTDKNEPQEREKSESILDGTSEIISDFLEFEPEQCLSKLFPLSVSRNLHDDGGRNFFCLLTKLYAKIKANYEKGKNATAGRKPSDKKNWISRCKITLKDGTYHRREVILERSVAMLSDAGMMPDWRNQIPTASGLVKPPASDKSTNLDLIKLSGDVAKFIELKWDSNTPASAIFQVLNYGLIYLFCRVNAKELGYTCRDLMKLRHIDLEVVAPSKFYAGHDLSWLECKLCHAIKIFSLYKTRGELSMGFKILALPQDFDKFPFENEAKARDACKSDPPTQAAHRVCKAFENLSPPIWSRAGGHHK